MKCETLKVQRITNKSDFLFDFEKSEVYKLALEFADDVFRITERLPMVFQFSIGDNFKRASLPISNNIAEGSGKSSAKEKRYFYKIALTSDRECISMITLLKRRDLITNDEKKLLRDTCIRISQMVFNLVGSVKQRLALNVKRSTSHGAKEVG